MLCILGENLLHCVQEFKKDTEIENITYEGNSRNNVWSSWTSWEEKQNDGWFLGVYIWCY